MSYTNFTLDIDADGIALVTWDMPGRSMNVFTEEAMRELNAIVDKVAGDAPIKGAVITSGKDTFSGGADITLLQKMLTTFAAEKPFRFLVPRTRSRSSTITPTHGSAPRKAR